MYIFQNGDRVIVSGKVGTFIVETSDGLLIRFDDPQHELNFYPYYRVNLLKSGTFKKTRPKSLTIYKTACNQAQRAGGR
jgi:hypothetical protein